MVKLYLTVEKAQEKVRHEVVPDRNRPGREESERMILNKRLNISTMQMYYFIEAADCGSFTLAAQQLYTTPSTLSKAVSAIERELDVQLFVRNKKRLYITEAGQHLCRRWKAALAGMEQSVLECRAMRGGSRTGLVVGCLDTHTLASLVVPLLRGYADVHPDARVTVETGQAQDMRKGLIGGVFDVVFTVLYDIEQLGAEHFDYKLVDRGPHCACVLDSSPLAAEEQLEVGQLREYDFLSISPMYTPSYHAMVRELCAGAGFEPRVLRFVPSAHALAFNLSGPRELFICDRFYSNAAQEGVRLVPLKGTHSGVVAAWRKDNEKPELRRFVQALPDRRPGA